MNSFCSRRVVIKCPLSFVCVYVSGAKAIFYEFRLFCPVVEWRVEFLAPCFATCWMTQFFL